MPTREFDGASIAERLFALRPRGTKLGIHRMRMLAEELGHPENSLPSIHIAGTNGKGSVAAMLESILRSSGWRVGLYTSPHLLQVGERVQVNRVPLSTAEIVELLRDIDPAADRVARQSGEEDRPSFFEYMTAMAFLHFRQSKCDIAVIETGLGGEFDATNIVSPEVSVITSIGLDHCEWLGNTLAAIAQAKAGIIKRGAPLVLGKLPAEADAVIRARAAQVGAPVVSVNERFGEALENHPRTNLAGDYQRWNAATATLAAEALSPKWHVTPQAISTGLMHVSWPGRWEQRTIGARTLILDASHNPEGAQVLDRNLTQLREQTGRRAVIIVGVLGAERATPLLETIARHAAAIHLVVPNQPRASTFEMLAKLIPASFTGPIVRSTVADLFPDPTHCTAGGELDPVVVTGSIYLLGEVLARLHRG
jgi:dihydrofolate synthase/folylpolyglutamate synthase